MFSAFPGILVLIVGAGFVVGALVGYTRQPRHIWLGGVIGMVLVWVVGGLVVFLLR